MIFSCIRYSALEPIFHMQIKISKVIHFLNRRETSQDIFISNKILSVYELHLYELMKIVLRSVKVLHSINCLNTLFTYQTSVRSTPMAHLNLLYNPCFKTKIETFQITHRCIRSFNILTAIEMIPTHIKTFSWSKIQLFYNSFKESFLLNNSELVRHIYDE